MVAGIAVLGLVAVTACSGGKDGGDSSGDSGSDAVAPAGTDAEASIIWWGWTPGPPATDHYIEAFNAVYPNIKVEWKQLDIDGYNAAIAPALGTDTVDVYEMSAGSANGGAEVYGVNAFDLTADVEAALGADWKDKLSPLGVDYMTVDGRLVSLSAGAVYAGNLWINEDLFNQYGLTPPKTYDEWKSVCATFKENGVGCFVQGANQGAFNIDTYHELVEQVSPGAFDKALAKEVAWTDDVFLQAMNNWKALFDDGIMQEGAAGLMQYPEANNLFLQQKYAMVMMGTWYTMNVQPEAMITAMESAGVSNPVPFTIAPIDFPDMVGKGNTGIMFGDADYGVGVSLKSKNAAASKAFALFLGTSEEGQQAVADSLNLIPALAGITPNWDNIELVNDSQKQTVQDLFAHANEATSPRFGNINADMNDALMMALSNVATGTATPEKALAELQSQAESVG
jgi:ABC-type glycerol-3-phosphate transport system substrate-binding protein